jgi:DNA-binding CsgD family transcriptional regulator
MAAERVVDPALAAVTLAAGDSPLTPRERGVPAVARSGSTVAEIATKLYLSEETVRNDLSSAIAKTRGPQRDRRAPHSRRARLAVNGGSPTRLLRFTEIDSLRASLRCVPIPLGVSSGYRPTRRGPAHLRVY